MNCSFNCFNDNTRWGRTAVFLLALPRGGPLDGPNAPPPGVASAGRGPDMADAKEVGSFELLAYLLAFFFLEEFLEEYLESCV